MAIIKLNKENLFYNLEMISNQTGSKEKVAIVLKDNAYSHGLKEIAKLASEFGIKKAVVRTLDEALKIQDFFDYILILAQKEFHTYSHTFHITLNSLEDINRVPKNSNVHIKVDTGMHRNGILPNQLEEAILGLLKKNVNITGVFTHHKSADILGTDFFYQKSIFSKVKLSTKRICEKLNIPIPAFHSCNSAALFRISNFNEDFARVGLASYGYLDMQNVFETVKLKPVLSLWANKIATRQIKTNQSLGYGGVYKAKNNILVSTYDIGYGDGFFRLDGSKVYKTPNGYEVLGKVSMDNLSLNSTDEEVCIFDDVSALAKIHNTIKYEILTNLKENITRIVI